jgi:hypothetical protein
MRHSSVNQLQVDTYMAAILTSLTAYPHISEVEVDREGRWRPVVGGGGGGQELPWHQPGDAVQLPAAGMMAVKPEPG